MRLLKSLAVFVGVISLFIPIRALGQYVEVGVNLFERPNGDLHSAASATCYDFLFRFDAGCQLAGTHEIRDINNGLLLGFRDYQTFGEYSGFLSRAPLPGHCYRARIDGRKIGTGISNALGTSGVCVEAVDDPEIPSDGCPILLDLDLNGFHLTGVENPVFFDLDADGAEEALAWTSSGQRDSFLCMDRNSNGMIDDGSELFGQATPLAGGGHAFSGYIALAQLDRPDLGGNLDGFIGHEDSIYSSLCAWTDLNRDGRSQAGEISGLATAGISRVGYEYKEQLRQDSHGNVFLYSARVLYSNPKGRPRAGVSYDVFFKTP